MAVSKRVRFEVLRRDRHMCRYCGSSAPDVVLVIDHVAPVALGGSDDPSNLVTACRECNSGKTSIAPDSAIVADVRADALRWAQAMRQAAEETLGRDAEVQAACDAVAQAWTAYRAMPSGWEESIAQFLAAGLPTQVIVQMVGVANNARNVSNRWDYFCGCCWKRIRQLQERAGEIVGSEVAASSPTVEAEVSPPTVLEFFTSYRASEVEETWQWVCEAWREQFGTDMALCLCTPGDGRPRVFCGDYACMIQLCGMAQAFLLGFDTATAQFITLSTTEPAAPTPQVPAPPAPEPEAQYPNLYDPAKFKIAETLEQELAELQAARRRARAASRAKVERDGS